MIKYRLEMERLANIIFAPTHKCELTADCLGLIRPIPDKIDIQLDSGVNSGSHVHATGVTRVETSDITDSIIDTLYRRPTVTTDMADGLISNLYRPEIHMLSVSDIAECLGLGGELVLLNPSEAVSIRDTVSYFLEVIRKRIQYEPTFVIPPKTDIDCFVGLIELLRTMAEDFDTGTGWSLSPSARKTSSGLRLKQGNILNSETVRGNSVYNFE